MNSEPLSICQFSPRDQAGGAEQVAWNLFRGYRAAGHDSWLAVGQKFSADPNVLLMPQERGGNPWSRFWWRRHFYWLDRVKADPRAWKRSRRARRLAEPGSVWDKRTGREDFRYPGAWQLPRLLPRPPQILHGHNLHGGYFDLRALPWLSRQAPLLLTLHDAWLLSGHCAHSLDCERWKTGCGQCPDLNIPPAIQRDATAFNWQRKQDIFRRSRLFIATPSQWLMDKVQQSILAAGIQEARVIPYGIDLETFKPGSQAESRARLKLPPSAKILLFAALGIRKNYWKDIDMVRAAVPAVAERMGTDQLLFVALGDTAPDESVGRAIIRYIPFLSDPAVVADYYRAADAYVHAARADTFPNVVLEAQACGCPVVATCIGGIPEQIEDGITGFLVPGGDAPAMASRIHEVLADGALRQRMSLAAADRAAQLYDLRRHTADYLDWYRQILEQQKSKPPRT